MIDGAWQHLTFTIDPLASSLAKAAADAQKVGLLDNVDLKGIYDLRLLNQVLRGRGKQEVKGAT